MKILLDCDVLLDVLAGRQPFLPDSARVLDSCEAGKNRGAAAWHTLANTYHLADDPKKTLKSFEELLTFIEVVAGDTKWLWMPSVWDFPILRMRCKVSVPESSRRILSSRET